ncbi:MAG: hypothetical protein AMJ79_14150 [Phycisphaerae bacterium SM23_30]|nr:MAG: hypothetical protein AMJ79_14150 [Phycisphaerae bacterium SM23_30]
MMVRLAPRVLPVITMQAAYLMEVQQIVTIMALIGMARVIPLRDVTITKIRKSRIKTRATVKLEAAL